MVNAVPFRKINGVGNLRVSWIHDQALVAEVDGKLLTGLSLEDQVRADVSHVIDAVVVNRRHGLLLSVRSLPVTGTAYPGRTPDEFVRPPSSWRKARLWHAMKLEAEMKFISATFGMVALCAVSVGAQTQTTTVDRETRKIVVTDGTTITVVGCIEKNPGGGYMLTDLASGGLLYTLVTDEDMTTYLGRYVSIRGKATDLGDAKMTIESTVTTNGRTEKATTEIKGAIGLHYLGVESVEMIVS
jgi:hypothetical protein